MAAAVPTQEPLVIRAGDTATWTKSFADYPVADGWALSYSGQSEDAFQITFTGAISGNHFLITLAAAITAQWEPGIYKLNSYVTLGSQRFTVGEFVIGVLPDLARDATLFDLRTKAKRILDLIDKAFLAQKQTMRTNIEGVELYYRTYEDMIQGRNYWANIYAAETARITGRNSRIIRAQFSEPI